MPALIENAFVCDFVTVSTTSCTTAIPDFVILGSAFTNQATFLTALGNAFVSNAWALSYTIDSNTITVVWDTEFFKDVDCCDFIITVTPARITGPPCNDPTQTTIPYLYLSITNDGAATNCCEIEISGGEPGCCFEPSDMYQLRFKMEKWFLANFNEKILREFRFLTTGKVTEPNLRLRQYNDVTYLMLLIYFQKLGLQCSDEESTIFGTTTIQQIKNHFLCLGIDITCLFEMAEIGNFNNCCNEIPVAPLCPCVDEVPKNLPTQYLTLDKNIEGPPTEFSTPFEYKCCDGDLTFTVVSYSNTAGLPVTVNFDSYTQTDVLEFDITFDNQAAIEGQKGDIVIDMIVCGEEVHQTIKIDIIDTCVNTYPPSLPLITQEFDINTQTIEDFVFASTVTYDCCYEPETLSVIQVGNLNANLGLTYTGPLVNTTVTGTAVSYTFTFNAFTAVKNSVGDYFVKLKLCNDREITQLFRFNVIDSCVVNTSSLDNITVDVDVQSLTNPIIPVSFIVPSDIECCGNKTSGCPAGPDECIRLSNFTKSSPYLSLVGGLDTLSCYCEGNSVTLYVQVIPPPSSYTATATLTAIVCGIPKSFTITFNLCVGIPVTPVGLSTIEITESTPNPVSGSFNLNNFNCCDGASELTLINIVDVPGVLDVITPALLTTYGPGDPVDYSFTFTAPEDPSGTYPYTITLVFDSCNGIIEIDVVFSYEVPNVEADCGLAAEGSVGNSIINYNIGIPGQLIIAYDTYNIPDPINVYKGNVTSTTITTLHLSNLGTTSPIPSPFLGSLAGSGIWAVGSGTNGTYRKNIAPTTDPSERYVFSGIIVLNTPDPEITVTASNSNWWYKVFCNNTPINTCGGSPVNHTFNTHSVYDLSDDSVAGYKATEAFIFESSDNVLRLTFSLDIAASVYPRGYRIDLFVVSEGTTNRYIEYYVDNVTTSGINVASTGSGVRLNSTALYGDSSVPYADGTFYYDGTSSTVAKKWAIGKEGTTKGPFFMDVPTLTGDKVVCIMSSYSVNDDVDGIPDHQVTDFDLEDSVTITSSCLGGEEVTIQTISEYVFENVCDTCGMGGCVEAVTAGDNVIFEIPNPGACYRLEMTVNNFTDGYPVPDADLYHYNGYEVIWYPTGMSGTTYSVDIGAVGGIYGDAGVIITGSTFVLPAEVPDVNALFVIHLTTTQTCDAGIEKVIASEIVTASIVSIDCP